MAAPALAAPRRRLASLDEDFLREAIAHRRRDDLNPVDLHELTARVLELVDHWRPETGENRDVLWPWPETAHLMRPKLPSDAFMP